MVLADPAAATPVAATVAARMRLVSYPAVKAWLLRCADKHHHDHVSTIPSCARSGPLAASGAGAVHVLVVVLVLVLV